MKNAIIMLLLVFFTGCVASVKQATVQQPINIPTGKETKPIQFRKIVVKIPRGTQIGAVQSGLLCLPTRNLTWRGGKTEIGGDELSDVFREELQKANYTVVGNPDALFDDPSEWKAEFLVAGLVNDIQASICYPLAGFGNWRDSKGEAYIKVNWQVYSRLDRKVVYEVTTEGSNKINKTSSTAADDLFLNAFAMATQNLIADKKFHELVMGLKEVGDGPSSNKIRISHLNPFATPINDHINDVRAGVVTIFAGDGHGSGFFISPDGYLLTNSHVVGGAKIVKIKLITGREVIGEVIRTDIKRDVAIIKSEEKQASPLPINDIEINVGEDVYSIGSPLHEKFDVSLTKGIVSAYRVEEGIKYIQSDVNVLPGSSGGPLVDSKGNVVGITARGIMLGKTTTGLNFFVPINEAFKSLNIDRIK